MATRVVYFFVYGIKNNLIRVSRPALEILAGEAPTFNPPKMNKTLTFSILHPTESISRSNSFSYTLCFAPQILSRR